MLSRQLFDADLPGFDQALPPRALVLSALALGVAALAGLAFPSSAAGYSTATWMLALIPPFLLAYYKGWVGAAAALAAGMVAFTLVELGLAWLGGTRVAWPTVGVVTLALIMVSLGAGSLSESLLRMKAQALYMAYADPLTGLPNRRMLDFALLKCHAAAERGERLAVALLDVDGFSAYNNRYGRQAGDEALRTIADIIDRNTRLMNMSGRFGGDEFLALLPGERSSGAILFAERVREAVAETKMPRGGRCTVSVGIAAWVGPMRCSDDLLDSAHGALVESKCAGGNRSNAAPVPADAPDLARAVFEPTDADMLEAVFRGTNDRPQD